MTATSPINQTLLDTLWDFTDPAASAERFRQAEADPAYDDNARAELRTQLAEAHRRGWAQTLEELEEGLNAAAAIGDDRIQSRSGRGVQPDKFTHGSSAQRLEWFRRGLESGRMDACDTFGR